LLHNAGVIGVGAVNENLHIRLAEVDMASEVGTQSNDAVHLAGEHQIVRFGHRRQNLCVEVRRKLKTGGNFHGIGRRLLDDHGDRHIHHVKRDAIAK
jgi:hypothetical protein